MCWLSQRELIELRGKYNEINAIQQTKHELEETIAQKDERIHIIQSQLETYIAEVHCLCI